MKTNEQLMAEAFIKIDKMCGEFFSKYNHKTMNGWETYNLVAEIFDQTRHHIFTAHRMMVHEED